jgi:hypothetical protein
MNPAVRLMIIAGLSALTCGCMTNTGATNMTQHFPPGAQDPKSPHPGTITAKYYWNDSTETWTVSDLPESFIFRCFDKNGERAQRANAAWCIPVVEVETVSVDENGNPVAPNEADSVSISEYGPGHTFIEHTQSVPHLKRQRELDRQQRTPPQEDAKPPSSPQTFIPHRSSDTLADYEQPLADVQLSWWARVKAWLGLA